MQHSSASHAATGGLTEFARIFATYSAALRVADLPATVVGAAKTNLFDTLACAIAGSNAPGVAEVRGLVESWGGAPQAPVWCGKLRLPAHHAAWVNGVMAHARDFDDTHDAAVLHAGVSVIPAALAAAELRPEATGADLLCGIVAGLELVCRLGIATTIGIIDSGFIYSSLFGYFGATAAAARVLGLTADQTVDAIGIAYSQAAGTHQVTRDGALTKRMQPGFAAKAALVSVELARRGIRGAQNVFDGIDGLFRTYLRDGYDPQALRARLGEHFEFTALSYKPYPCCRFDHTAIDAALAVRGRPGFDAAAIRRVTVGVNHQAYEAVCTPPEIRRHPATIVQAQFSIPFTVACALLDGHVALAHFTDAGIRRPDLLALAARVDCAVDDDIQRDWARSISPTALAVDIGTVTFRQRTNYPRGHARHPMTAADFAAKLDDCMKFSQLAWPPDTANRLGALVDGLAQLAEAREVGAVLHLR